MKNKHLTDLERLEIEHALRQRISIKKIAAQLEGDRTAISGVNLDEEAARLIQYQQAYQASAKMIQIAQNVFDSLISSMGR